VIPKKKKRCNSVVEGSGLDLWNPALKKKERKRKEKGPGMVACNPSYSGGRSVV
jgi:hypothetical protein